ncbi:hypothetical protein CAEBREN_32573 [Caenorhabditis brenneri]|uniref:Secreted protein n=1 Tax=Caenorhabditis brenneri TaxID=135651 RepID=G0NWV2_CAEBE|nr:hypothetical protein CAEBREN_32573 [Caenorhabditis brenneri]
MPSYFLPHLPNCSSFSLLFLIFLHIFVDFSTRSICQLSPPHHHYTPSPSFLRAKINWPHFINLGAPPIFSLRTHPPRSIPFNQSFFPER